MQMTLSFLLGQPIVRVLQGKLRDSLGAIFLLVFCVQHHSPSHREGIPVYAQLVGLEEQARENWRDSKGLPIWEMNYLRCHCRIKEHTARTWHSGEMSSA